MSRAERLGVHVIAFLPNKALKDELTSSRTSTTPVRASNNGQVTRKLPTQTRSMTYRKTFYPSFLSVIDYAMWTPVY